MGYCVNQGETKFKIKGKNIHYAWSAINALDTGVRHHWVDPGFSKEESFYDCLMCWSWEPKFDEKGNIVDISFQTEKMGDEKKLFDAMAPYVEPGCFISMSGEDGESWRWVFVGGECHSVSPTYDTNDLENKPKYSLNKVEWRQGRKYSVRYSVDKDGDRILEGENSKEDALKYILQDAGIQVEYHTIEM